MQGPTAGGTFDPDRPAPLGGGWSRAQRGARREEDGMKVLVTAATKHGATGEIAQVIGDALRERGAQGSGG